MNSPRGSGVARTQTGCESLTRFKRDLVTYPVKE